MSRQDLTFTLETNGRSPPEDIIISRYETLHNLTSLVTGINSDCNGRGHNGDFILICDQQTWVASALADEATPLNDIQPLGSSIIRIPTSIAIACRNSIY